MSERHIIFVPGKNPKPEADYHRELLWRTMVEGVNRVEPSIANEIEDNAEDFLFIDWNYLYYLTHDDINTHSPFVEALFWKDGPSEEDIEKAQAWRNKLEAFIYHTVDSAPVLMRLLRGQLKEAAAETNRYFDNEDNIACEIREQLKKELRPLLEEGSKVMVVGHSLGTVIAYDTLWELSHEEKFPGTVDTFLSLGSPLGMKYVQERLVGADREGAEKYPTNIHNWINVAADGDLIALDRELKTDYEEMIELNLVNSIVDHNQDVYNFFHEEDGLNCHRSYGYLINPVVGQIFADWWKGTDSTL